MSKAPMEFNQIAGIDIVIKVDAGKWVQMERGDIRDIYDCIQFDLKLPEAIAEFVRTQLETRELTKDLRVEIYR